MWLCADEPLYLIHHIDIMVSVIGSNLLQSIKESLQLPPEYELIHNPHTGKDEVSHHSPATFYYEKEE